MEVPSPGLPCFPIVVFSRFAQRSTNLQGSKVRSIQNMFSYSASTSMRKWKASSVPLPLKTISGLCSLSAGIFPTTIICSRLSSQKPIPLNFITIGREGLYTENSEARVMLFFSSGVYTSPISLGGKGISWQEVAAQVSSLLGTQVLFQAHTATSSS